MAKCTARRRGVHVSSGTSVSFKKDDDTGLYRKIEHDIKMRHLEHSTKMSGKPRISEELYCLGSENDWDYKFEITGFDGNPQTLYFVESKES